MRASSNKECCNATTHQEIILDLNADVAEWCPLPAHHRLFAAGTYQLNEATQTREGRLYLYKLTGNIARGTILGLNPILSHPLPGIFDLRWLPQGPRPALAAALADGSLRILVVETSDDVDSINISNPHSKIVENATSTPLEGDMALSVDCGSWKGSDALLSSYSSGSVALHQLTPAGLECLRTWQGHDLEAWIASFDAWCPWLAYSGGDDSAFKAWDLRQGGEAPVWMDRKSHSAGVCCIASSPMQEYLVCTGSYDEGARMWDIRAGARPMARAEVKAGGGVWRLKWHPTDPHLLLAACMHGGFTIIHVDGAQGSINVVERYALQQTLAYGAGWCSEVGADGTSVAATCSFYDRLLHVWSPETSACIHV